MFLKIGNYGVSMVLFKDTPSVPVDPSSFNSADALFDYYEGKFEELYSNGFFTVVPHDDILKDFKVIVQRYQDEIDDLDDEIRELKKSVKVK